jgi:flagellar M-ring protein FliF
VQKLDEYNSESKGALLRKEIKEFSHTNPDVVAQLIRSLLREDV